MEDFDLICNFNKCRKRLTNVAYVTACSHVFCDEHGTSEFNKSTTCPACQTTLSAKFDIVRNTLQPSEQYKSMILAGLKPDVISEISSRALSLWLYQSNQERTYQEYMVSKTRERATELEQYYEKILSRTTLELNTVKSQLTATKKEIEACREETEVAKKKCAEFSDKLMEKDRQHQKLKSMYESMRRKVFTMSTLAGGDKTALSCPYGISNLVQGDHDMYGTLQKPCQNISAISPTEGFAFNPIHNGEDEPANRVQKRFSLGIGTPRA